MRWRETFLEALVDTGAIAAATERAGISRSTAYNHRRADTAFADQWDEALGRHAMRSARTGADVVSGDQIIFHLRAVADALSNRGLGHYAHELHAVAHELRAFIDVLNGGAPESNRLAVHAVQPAPAAHSADLEKGDGRGTSSAAARGAQSPPTGHTGHLKKAGGREAAQLRRRPGADPDDKGQRPLPPRNFEEIRF